MRSPSADLEQWFNSVGNTQLRPKLLEATKDKPWADVQNLKWVTNGVDAENALNIEDFCKYKYIVYTEVNFHPLLILFLRDINVVFRASHTQADFLFTSLAAQSLLPPRQPISCTRRTFSGP